MIKLSNTIAQTVEVGQSVTFNQVLLHTGCGESHRAGSGAVKMRGNGNYEIGFFANVSGATAGTPLQLNIALGGERLLETTMIVTPAAADALQHVGLSVPVKNCCGDYDRVTVINTGTTPITIGANPLFYVKREG